MKNYFEEFNDREIQKFNVSLTFSIMRKFIDLLGVLGIIFAVSFSYINDMDFICMLAMVLGIILLVQLFLLPGYIAQHKTSPRTTAIFVLGIIIWLIPITWPAALVWACAEPSYEREVKPIQKEKYLIFQIISITAIILISIFFYFGVCHSAIQEKYKANAETSKIEHAVKTYYTAKSKLFAQKMNVSNKCAKSYISALRYEGYIDENNTECSNKEIQSIKESYKKQIKTSNGYIEPVFSNNGMPKSLVLEGVPILCFEKANLNNNDSCSKKQLETIKKYFAENKNINWEYEYFEY